MFTSFAGLSLTDFTPASADSGPSLVPGPGIEFTFSAAILNKGGDIPRPVAGDTYKLELYWNDHDGLDGATVSLMLFTLVQLECKILLKPLLTVQIIMQDFTQTSFDSSDNNA